MLSRRLFVFVFVVVVGASCPDRRFLPTTLNAAALLDSYANSLELSDLFYANTSAGFDFLDVVPPAGFLSSLCGKVSLNLQICIFVLL